MLKSNNYLHHLVDSIFPRGEKKFTTNSGLSMDLC